MRTSILLKASIAATVCGIALGFSPAGLSTLSFRKNGLVGDVCSKAPCRQGGSLGTLRMQQKSADHDILLRVAKGEKADRTPVWLMRQAGRYMKAFKEYSNKYPFRMRSETPDIAIELSLQPFRAFGTDGVIMFSDILTPLPSMGIEFDVVKGKGPIIPTPIRSMEQVKQLKPISDPDSTTPFLRPILETLRKVGADC
jgi:uroporphyrinogen-III decarboxylase